MNNSTSSHAIAASAIWGIPEIAAYLKVSEDSARQIARADAFPAPLAARQRNRRWFASDVVAYLASSAQKRRDVA